MWRTLDPIHILGLVSENIIYESFWVIFPIVSKDEFLTYIEQKLNTIKEAVLRGKISIQVQIVVIEGIDDQYFIRMNHTIGKNDFDSLISVSVSEDGLINKISFLPTLPQFKLKQLEVLLE